MSRLMKAEEMTYDKNIDLPTSESPSKSMVISELSWSASDIAATFYRVGASPDYSQTVVAAYGHIGIQ